ncbi:MAG: serine hydrolase domain-containing protein [Bacillota bacterium]
MTNKKLDNFLEKALEYYDLPGLAVSIGIGEKSKNRNAGLAYCNAVGYKDFEEKEPLLPEHIFHMASITKLFVGTSILQLWEKGLIDLDGLLIDYLPWFEMADESYKLITIRQLLSHTSGMPDVKDYCWDQPEIDEEALERYVRSPEVKEAYLLWNPGEGFAYSNIGYEILGVIIASISGMPFENYVKQNIFEPLKMRQSTLLTFERGIYSANGMAPNLCSPHKKNEEKKIVKVEHFPYNRAHGPSSTLTSNVFDLEKWALAHLHHEILKKESYDIAWEKQAIVPNNGENICLSWFCREQNGFTLYGHEGTDDGFRASFWICPQLELSIVVCSNISGAPVKKISKQLFDALTL